MRTCIDHLMATPHLTATKVREEAEFITNRLESCRMEGLISNDAFLDAGVIQGALEMIANHLDMGVDAAEVRELLNQQLSRAKRLEEKHNGLDSAVELTR
jgi:hypothetical protein